MKTREEIDRLKEEWLIDPCWNLEDAEGFEDHREELALFSAETHNNWRTVEELRVFNRARDIGCSPQTILLIEHLEYRIANLEKKSEGL